MKGLLVSVLLFSLAGSRQTSKQFVVGMDSVPTYVNEARDVHMTVLLDRASTDSNTALSLGTFLPGAIVAEHVHQGSAEILYILSGRVEMTIGPEKMVAAAGSAVYIPPDVPHSARVVSSEPVKAVQVYAPGGPEQRFKQWERIRAGNGTF